MSRLVTFAQLGRHGRLCNQMYQIAGTIGVARRNGFDFGFPEWINYDHRDRFGSSEDVNLQRYFINPLPHYDDPPLPDRFVHWGYHDTRLTHSVSLSGHMQSERYFSHCYDEVAWYFRMVDELPLSDYCAIHVRLGDYDNAYHPRLDMRYYEPAMAHFGASQKFLVFSDDIAAAKTMFDSRVDYCEGGDYISDFRRMKRCAHFIIGNSTFSSMAAVLGEVKDKQVIAPRPWFGPSYTDITAEDIYGPDWKVVNWA